MHILLTILGVLSKWAAADVIDLNILISRLSKAWTARLNLAERQEL